jgi:hypothetical protein
MGGVSSATKAPGGMDLARVMDTWARERFARLSQVAAKRGRQRNAWATRRAAERRTFISNPQGIIVDAEWKPAAF